MKSCKRLLVGLLAAAALLTAVLALPQTALASCDQSPTGHAWEAADNYTARRCKVCGKYEQMFCLHIWTPANCMEPEYCCFCGIYRGEIDPNGHVFEGDTCTICGQGKFIVGDINGDGKVNLKDAILALQAANGKETSVERSAADVNGDGKVNLKDAILILKRANGNKDPFPAEK